MMTWQSVVTLGILAAAAVGSLAMGSDVMAALFGGAAANVASPVLVRRAPGTHDATETRP